MIICNTLVTVSQIFCVCSCLDRAQDVIHACKMTEHYNDLSPESSLPLIFLYFVDENIDNFAILLLQWDSDELSHSTKNKTKCNAKHMPYNLIMDHNEKEKSNKN